MFGVEINFDNFKNSDKRNSGDTMGSKKLVHILQSIEFSGAEIMLHQAADIFKEHELDCTLLATTEGPGRFEQPMRERGYTIDSVAAAGKFERLSKFYKYFKNNKFDVVVIHTEGLYLWQVLLLKLTGHHNIVRTFHNCWIFTGLHRTKTIIHRRLATWLGVKNHAIGLATQINESERFKNPTTIVNNWMKLTPEFLTDTTGTRQAKRAELNIDPNDYVITSIGGCSPIKNHAFIINLVEALNKLGVKVTYLHLGTGADEVQEQVLAKQIGIDAQVIFAGNRQDIPQLLIASDIYLMPSQYEGLSIALLEAMYYNGLVIVNDAPGLAKTVIDKETGYVIDVGEINQYLDLIKGIHDNTIDVSRIRQGAKLFVEQNFSMEKNVPQLIEFYKQ